MGQQYMRQTLASIVADNNMCLVKKIFWRQYMLLDDNICCEYPDDLSPKTKCVGTTMYVVKRFTSLQVSKDYPYSKQSNLRVSTHPGVFRLIQFTLPTFYDRGGGLQI